MKMTFPLVLSGALLIVAACPQVGKAQTSRPAAPTAATPHKVGLVDVGYIFDNYQKLKDRREALQAEIEASANDVEIASIQQQMESLKGQMEKVTKGSDKASEIEQQIIELNAKGQARLATMKRDFMRKEVNMYKEVYDEVSQLVAQYAEARRYTLVLRYQREPVVDPAEGEDPRQMMNRVNQMVVFHEKDDDITDRLLEHMNNEYAKTAGAQQPAGAPGQTIQRTAGSGAAQPRN